MMAAIVCRSFRTENAVNVPRDLLLRQIASCEKRAFSSKEAMDFGLECRKRNVEVVVIIDEESEPMRIHVVAYLVTATAKAGRHVSLNKICVDPSHRSMGLGTRLLKELIEMLSRRGKSQVRLWVDGHNHVALKLYTKVGFQRVSEVANYYGPGREGVSMVLYIQ